MAFIALLALYEAWFYPIGYRAYFQHDRSLPSIAGSLVLAVLWVWVSVSSRAWLKALYAVGFALIVLVEYGYLLGQGAFLGVADFDLLFITPNYYHDAVALFFDWRALVPVAVYAALLIGLPRPSPAFGLRAGAACVGLTFAFYSILLPPGVSRYPTVSVAAFSRTMTNAAWTLVVVPWYRSRASSNQDRREAVPVRASARPANNIVLVVDESVRADHLHVNGYARPTTPFLEELAAASLLRTWGDACAGATSTTQSNWLLLTGVSTLPDVAHATDRWPTIFQFAKAMGYRTTYLNGQTIHAWAFPSADLQYIDDVRNIEAYGFDVHTDFRIATWLAASLRDRTGEFIVVNKKGIHFSYDNSYPASARAWRPTIADVGPRRYGASEAVPLVNSYDNAIRFNVDGFFREFLKDRAILAHTSVVYTSDHGQTLREHGESWAHNGPGVLEAMVPLLLISGAKPPVDTAYRASHGNVMATLLDLMGVPQRDRRHLYAISLLTARREDSTPRRFLFGDLYGRASERGGVVAFDAR
jgi:glucan phosphoethanolaminetransferase (alkaline phosphatase superfamily)